MAKYLILLLLIVHLLSSLWLPVYGVNILAVLPSVWKSHYLFGRRLLQQLVAQQHNYSVTLISPHAPFYHGVDEEEATETEVMGLASPLPALPKIREIHIDGLAESWLDMGLSFDIEEIRQKSIMERFTRLIYAGTINVDLLLNDAKVRKLLRSGEHFDLLVVDLFLSDALLGLAYYYQIPTVVLSPTGANSWLNQMFGNPQSSALDPSIFLPYSERMNIWQRCVNTLMGLFERLTYNFFYMISQEAIYVKHFQPLCQPLANKELAELPHHRELTKNLSLLLMNSHPVLQYPRAYLPNILQVAGVHLQTRKELELPNHIKHFIESASGAVVYMSLGANLRTADLAREKLDVFMDVFTYMEDMRFIMKWELPKFVGELPKNILIAEWLPQEAILAHPKVKAFISTCGMMSVVEAIHTTTPILALPIYPEQEVAAKRLHTQNVALTLDFDAIAYDSLLYGIQQLTQNQKYSEHLQRLRQLFDSDYGKPIDIALHNIDLILKTSGGAFLKSHANHLSYLRAESLDVYVIILAGLICIIAVPFFVTCCILRKSYYSQATNMASYRVSLQTLPRSSSMGDIRAQGDATIDNVRRRRTSTSASASSASTSASSDSPVSARKMAKRDALTRNQSQSSQQSD